MAQHAARDRPQARWLPALAVLVIAAALYGIVHSLSGHAPPPSSATESTLPSKPERTSGTPRLALTAFAPSPVAARALSGRVETDRGAALGGARVCVADPHADCCDALSCTFSDARGHFVLHDAGSASTLFASHAGYLPLTRALARQESGAALVLKLRAGGARIAGQVLDGTGGPIGGAWIQAKGDAELAVGVSDDDGYFELFLPAGSSPLRVRAEGYSELRRQVWAPSDGLRVLLVPAASLGGHVVARGSGEPVGGVAVRALNTTGLRASPALELSAADGSFELASLVAGEYVLSAANGRWRSDEQAVRLDLGAEQRALVIEVAPATTLTAEISVGGAACADGWISASGPVSVSSAISSEGPALLEGLLPGLYLLEVRCPPGAPMGEELQGHS